MLPTRFGAPGARSVDRSPTNGRSNAASDGGLPCCVGAPLPPMPLETFFVSTLVVALSELGDKTQLLALLLATRYRRARPIILGILVATLANHALAALLGTWLRDLVPVSALRWLVAASFIAVALWTLRPEPPLQANAGPTRGLGVFALTVTTFFMAEMGDKTQVATLVLAAQFGSLTTVVAGTTLGMLLADAPVVYLGQVAATRIPVRLVRVAGAALFLLLAIAALVAG
jgi:putative Ca2+/H+ antiporter (TMEM165/GDT1 family)